MKGNWFHGCGRRKTSVARVFVKPGEGSISVNGKPLEQYMGRESLRRMVIKPLEILGMLGKYDVLVNVCGGGPAGQAGATRLGLSRALLLVNPEDRGDLKKEGLLKRDPRAVERKKYGRHKARRRPQFSKR